MPILRNSFNSEAPTKLFEFTQGIDLDAHLAREEIQVQIAWAEELQKLGFLSKEELHSAKNYLNEALVEIQENRFEWKIEDEDIHMNLERFLTEKAGELGKKIHFGRSRNDLIATTLRLFCARQCSEAHAALKKLIKSLVIKAESDLETFIPGQTHLQHGQPLRLAHFWLAYAQAFKRDLELFEFAKGRALSEMPLGSGALSGVTIKIPLEALAEKLGFQNPPSNSYDLVSDRDFILDLLRAISSFGIHLSRISEDIIFYSSSAVGLFLLPKDHSTGSSMMPNKRNPDVGELSRAKSAHMISSFNNAACLMKGLPMSYNSDLHELKRVLLGSLEQFSQCVGIFPFFVEGIRVDENMAEGLLKRGNILATFVTEHKVLEGKSFREAYSETAAEIAKNASAFDGSGKNFMDQIRAAVEEKSNTGGTSRSSIRHQIAAFKHLL